jgi:CRP/FNR family transcriptional regulator
MLNSAIQTRLLENYPLLRDVPAPLLESLLNQAHHMLLPTGTIVFDENQPCQGFPLIVSGCIRVIKSAANGRELQLYRVASGESCILTSSCLLGHTSYQARGIVETDVDMVVLPASAFRALLEAYPPFRDYIFGLFADRLTDLMQLVTAVAFQKLDQRLATLLISKPSPIHTTHQALADELGSVREIVSRLLKNFAEQGWVKLGREQIELVDVVALKNFGSL